MVAIPETHLKAATQIPDRFVINEVPAEPGMAPLAATQPSPPLGPLAAFAGTFTGRGFNTIFRPQNPATPTELPIPQPNSDNILELNLPSSRCLSWILWAVCRTGAGSKPTFF
jgi:hypothetical protein